MQNMTKNSDAFAFEQLYSIIAFRGGVATAIITVIMLAFIIARDALGLVRWGMPPNEIGTDSNGSAACEYSPDPSGH
jgi:hypothetical protein